MVQKTVRIDSFVQKEIERYIERTGTEKELSYVVSRAILTEEEDRYNLRTLVGFLRKNVGYERVPDVWGFGRYENNTIHFSEDAHDYYDNPGKRRRYGHLNKTNYLESCVSSYLKMQKLKREMLDNVEVGTWYYPEEEQEDKGWTDVIWEDLKQTPSDRVPVLVEVIETEYGEHDRIQRKKVLEKYKKETGVSYPTALSHTRKALRRIVEGTEWRESLQSQIGNKEMEKITQEKAVPEFHRNRKRIMDEMGRIIQKVKSLSADRSADYLQKKRIEAAEELQELKEEIGRIFGHMKEEDKDHVVQEYRETLARLDHEMEKVQNGGYPARDIVF